MTNDEDVEDDPHFSSDGQRIAFAKDHNTHVVDIESGIDVPLTADGRMRHLCRNLDLAEARITDRGATIMSPKVVFTRKLQNSTSSHFSHQIIVKHNIS